MRIRAVLFDAYGTLFDVHSVIALAETLFPGQGAALSQAWRTRQLEYTWLRTLSNRYEDFWHVTGDALTWAAQAQRLPLTPAQHAQLLNAYLSLQPFPENLEVLRGLHAGGMVLGTLSNGTAAMLDAAIDSAGMRGLFAHVLSVDRIGRYKTDAGAYSMGTDAVGAPASEIAFVSSNCWDAIGATWFGYRTFWVNRGNAPVDQLDVYPEGTGSSLRDLPQFLAR
jgi:2-haloacid dehalogenase